MPSKYTAGSTGTILVSIATSKKDTETRNLRAPIMKGVYNFGNRHVEEGAELKTDGVANKAGCQPFPTLFVPN